jgi:hypothetical protein
MTPIFLMPPSGDFDHETGRRLTPLEHIRKYGTRLHAAWGRLPVFVDALGIDDETHQQGLTHHPLTELLGRAQAAGALACPATAMNRSQEYQQAVRRFVTRHPQRPICIRVKPLDDMESDSFAIDMRSFLDHLDCRPDRVVLVVDFASMAVLKVEEVEQFAAVVAERVYQALALCRWLKVVAAFTSFPAALKMKPGEVKLFSRTDWMAYLSLIEREPELLGRVAFGDYGIDTTLFSKSKRRVTPSAHLRYTTADHYLIVKGQQAKKPVGYAAIYPVANTLAKRDEFMGAAFSEGDESISRWAARDHDTTTGNASTWRWAGTDHHFAQVLRDLCGLAGELRADEEVGSEINQPSLFSLPYYDEAER